MCLKNGYRVSRKLLMINSTPVITVININGQGIKYFWSRLQELLDYKYYIQISSDSLLRNTCSKRAAFRLFDQSQLIHFYPAFSAQNAPRFYAQPFTSNSKRVAFSLLVARAMLVE